MHDLSIKKKFHRLFDIGVLSTGSNRFIGEGKYSDLFKDKARVHAESGDFLVALKGAEKKAEFRKAVVAKAKVAGWK